MKYELSNQQVGTLKDMVKGVRTSFQERPVIDDLLKALSAPIKEEPKK